MVSANVFRFVQKMCGHGFIFSLFQKTLANLSSDTCTVIDNLKNCIFKSFLSSHGSKNQESKDRSFFLERYLWRQYDK